MTPTSGRRPRLLLDTSVAVALVVADHEHHEATVDAVGRRVAALAGHAAFETFSVLTRLPPPIRRTPAVIAELLARSFAPTLHLSAAAANALFDRLAQGDIAGGSVYDALVGAAAAEHGAVLATRDRRAITTYRALDVEVEYLG